MSREYGNLEGRCPENYIVDTRPLCAGMPFILTDSAHPRMVLKHDCHFLVLNELAQIPSCNNLGFGYYFNDTRHLSQLEFQLNGIPLSLLSHDLHQGFSARFLYTNPQMGQIPQQKVTLERNLVLDDFLWEQIVLENFGQSAYELELEVKFQSDFADMFEVRGMNRDLRGSRMLPSSSADNSTLFLAYKGLDGILLETLVEFAGCSPNKLNDGVASYRIHLDVRSPASIEFCVKTRMGGETMSKSKSIPGFASALDLANEQYKDWKNRQANVETDNELFNLTLERSFNDFYILRQKTPKGYGIAAGIPWYSAVFGRDSAVSGIQVLPFMPQISREAIEVLAAYQGRKNDAFKAEYAGKIMHELRLGEMSRLGLVPHSPYYGTVDATQLWIMLYCEYLKWTADLEFAHDLWPAVKAAVAYLDRAAENGAGYIRYYPSTNGLRNQGWKDSDDSVMHTDGSLAEAPIAISEAQSYLYSARMELAYIADILGKKRFSNKLQNDAHILKEMFGRDFWLSGEKFVCLALDGQNKQVAVISSNAGHCLMSGILEPDQAQLVADRLMKSELHSGWGIRTLSDQTVAYNPVSYHNGSVWPHDNGIIIEGMRRLGRLDDMMKIMYGIAEVAMGDEEHRLPELFCGFQRNGTLRPVDYPVSCIPQAWAAGSILHMIKVCLNLQADAFSRSIRIADPCLPAWISKIKLRHLSVADALLDLEFESENRVTHAKVLKKLGKLKVIVES